MPIWKVPKITLSAVPSSEDSQGSESHYVHSHSVLLGKDTDASQQRGEAYQAESQESQVQFPALPLSGVVQMAIVV